MKKRARNYKAEYQRRIAKGLVKGLSRSQARGHPKATETTVAPKKLRQIGDARFQLGLKELRSGKSLKEAARTIRVSPERLRNQANAKGAIRRRGKRWLVREDLPRQVLIYSNGEAVTITVGDFKNASIAGRYMSAIGQFLRTNNKRYLAAFDGQFIRDISSKQYSLETQPNTVYRLATSSTESFEQVYRIIV